MYATLFDHLPAPGGPPKRERKRREPADNHVKYTRYPGKGDKEQVRWWLAGYGSVNCGLYDRELAAVVKRKLVPLTRGIPLTPLALWQALQVVLDELRRKGVPDLPDVLPMYVERVPGGFSAAVKKAGRELACAGPFDSPEAAHLAICELLAREFPKPEARELATLADYFGG